MRLWSTKTELPAERFVAWIGVARGKFFDWKKRYGLANEHNALIPRDHWLLDEERQAIINFHEKFPLEGYRRLAFMMVDQNVAAVSPSSVYRVLSRAGLLDQSTKPAVSSLPSLSTTTTCACTVPSPTSHQPIFSPVAAKQFGMSATLNSKPLAKLDASAALIPIPKNRSRHEYFPYQPSFLLFFIRPVIFTPNQYTAS